MFWSSPAHCTIPHLIWEASKHKKGDWYAFVSRNKNQQKGTRHCNPDPWCLAPWQRWPDVVGYAGICDGRAASYADSNPAPLRLLLCELLWVSRHQLCFSLGEWELAVVYGQPGAQAGPDHRHLQKGGADKPFISLSLKKIIHMTMLSGRGDFTQKELGS